MPRFRSAQRPDATSLLSLCTALGSAPVGLEEPVSTVPWDEHRHNPASDHARQLGGEADRGGSDLREVVVASSLTSPMRTRTSTEFKLPHVEGRPSGGRGAGDDAECRSPVSVGVLGNCGRQGEGFAAGSEGVGLRSRPAVTGEAVCAIFDVTLDGDEPATGREHAADLEERGAKVRPVVDGGQRPDNARPVIGDRQCVGRAEGVAQPLRPVGDPSDPQHHRCRVDCHHLGTERGGAASGDARPAADVDEAVAGREPGEADRERGVGIASAREADGGEEAAEPGEAWMVGMVVGSERVVSHAETLTVEPGFKSSGLVTDLLLTIGDVGARVGLATSAIRYYERRGLVQADARVSGQRRYREDTVRRLVFIGMLQDAGLDLDEIDGVLHANEVAAWKAIARRRLAALDAEIERLQRARAYLEGALLCRYHHPATDCRIMGAEIDRRLTTP